jgi:hypothetical protein
MGGFKFCDSKFTFSILHFQEKPAKVVVSVNNMAGDLNSSRVGESFCLH